MPAPATVLELGCGAGRVTGPLVAAGYRVTGVDESAEMLARVTGARTVRAPIQGLELGEAFDLVLLMSFLVNTADRERRQALLATCRRHLGPGGVLLLQREGDDWYAGFRSRAGWTTASAGWWRPSLTAPA